MTNRRNASDHHLLVSPLKLFDYAILRPQGFARIAVDRSISIVRLLSFHYIRITSRSGILDASELLFFMSGSTSRYHRAKSAV
jgi:hypothetical protein